MRDPVAAAGLRPQFGLMATLLAMVALQHLHSRGRALALAVSQRRFLLGPDRVYPNQLAGIKLPGFPLMLVWLVAAAAVEQLVVLLAVMVETETNISFLLDQ